MTDRGPPESRLAGPRLAVAAALACAAACTPPPPPPPGAIPLDVVVDAKRLTGAWEWIHVSVDSGAMIRERERWRFAAGADARHLVGVYRRDVLARALDGVPFECNQRLRYRQRALHTVTAEVTADGIRIVEGGYTATPSPCDPGLRVLGDYLAELDGDRLHLRWEGGNATLTRVADEPFPEAPPRPPAPAGRWTWAMTSWTKTGLIRHEDEDWELAVGPDGAVGGTYVRAVTVRSPDDTPLPCAGAPSYSFTDRYLVRGTRTDDGWRLDETAVTAGDHPCLADTPARTLDGATATLDGDFLILTWRGKRRQVLATAASP